jgi:hypothetical protein
VSSSISIRKLLTDKIPVANALYHGEASPRLAQPSSELRLKEDRAW